MWRLAVFFLPFSALAADTYIWKPQTAEILHAARSYAARSHESYASGNEAAAIEAMELAEGYMSQRPPPPRYQDQTMEVMRRKAQRYCLRAQHGMLSLSDPQYYELVIPPEVRKTFRRTRHATRRCDALLSRLPP